MPCWLRSWIDDALGVVRYLHLGVPVPTAERPMGRAVADYTYAFAHPQERRRWIDGVGHGIGLRFEAGVHDGAVVAAARG